MGWFCFSREALQGAGGGAFGLRLGREHCYNCFCLVVAFCVWLCSVVCGRRRHVFSRSVPLLVKDVMMTWLKRSGPPDGRNALKVKWVMGDPVDGDCVDWLWRTARSLVAGKKMLVVEGDRLVESAHHPTLDIDREGLVR